MGRVTTEQRDDLLARLSRTGAPARWVRVVRMGVSQLGECEVQVDAATWVVVRLAGQGEGPAGSLVADIETRAADGTVGHVRTVKATADRHADDANPRRSVRLSDDVWAALAEHGEPSSVLRDAAEEYLARRKPPLTR